MIELFRYDDTSAITHRSQLARASVPPGTSYYVYAWFDKDAALPYYIGAGVGVRGFQPHRATKRPLTWHRLPHRVVLIETYSDKWMSDIAEVLVIKHFDKAGAPLVNMRHTSKPQTKKATNG